MGFNWAFDWIERETHREEKRCRAPTGSWTLCHWPFFPPSARARRACAWPCTRMKEPTDRPDIDVVSSRAAREKSSTKHSVPRDYLSGPAKAAGKMRRLILSQEPPLLTRRRSRVNCLFFYPAGGYWTFDSGRNLQMDRRWENRNGACQQPAATTRIRPALLPTRL